MPHAGRAPRGSQATAGAAPTAPAPAATHAPPRGPSSRAWPPKAPAIPANDESRRDEPHRKAQEQHHPTQQQPHKADPPRLRQSADHHAPRVHAVSHPKSLSPVSPPQQLPIEQRLRHRPPHTSQCRLLRWWPDPPPPRAPHGRETSRYKYSAQPNRNRSRGARRVSHYLNSFAYWEVPRITGRSSQVIGANPRPGPEDPG
jgi:hypothetical protein